MPEKYAVINTDATVAENEYQGDHVAVPLAAGPFATYREANENAVSKWREVVKVEVDE